MAGSRKTRPGALRIVGTAEAENALNTFFPGVQIGADDGTPLTFRLDAHATSAGLTFLDF